MMQVTTFTYFRLVRALAHEGPGGAMKTIEPRLRTRAYGKRTCSVIEVAMAVSKYYYDAEETTQP